MFSFLDRGEYICDVITKTLMQFFSRKHVQFLRSTVSQFRKFIQSNEVSDLLLTMSKDQKHTMELRQRRQKLRDKAQKYVPGIVCHNVLGSGSAGAPACLYMFTDSTRYLFNCGEGAQRLAHEHKLKLSKLEHIFITHSSWENIGGLPGIALTIQEAGVPDITLHGPPETDSVFKATERFIVLRRIVIETAECTAESQYEDNVMTVKYIPIKDTEHTQTVSDTSNASTSEDESEDETDYYAHERKRKGHSESRAKRQRRISERVTKTVICYACHLKPRLGMLNLEKCVDKGVPPGPLLGKLKAGEDVVLENGSVVRACDVRNPDDPSPVFLVVDCPTINFLDSLMNNSVLCGYHEKNITVPEHAPYLIVHFTSQDVMDNPRYQEWMESFPQDTRHLVLNNANHCMGSVAIHRIQHQLHLVHPDIFPLLADNSIPNIEQNINNGNTDTQEDDPADLSSEETQTKTLNSEQKTNDSVTTQNGLVESDNNRIFRGRTLSRIKLRPSTGVFKDNEVSLDVKAFLEAPFLVEDFPESLAQLKEKLSQVNVDHKEYPHIVFLGTGSSIPNKTRNTSGILINISEDESIILDCGEGTYGQIVRFYGCDADKILKNVRAIFISHLHADHHIGLISLLKARRKGFSTCEDKRTPLFLLAPRQIIYWLSFYHHNFEPILEDFVLIYNGFMDINQDSGKKNQVHVEEYNRLLGMLHMSKIRTVEVKHCANSFGIALTHKDGWKITYSGDTMPCRDLITLGKDSDLLIHEATMEDELEDEAIRKLHSTTSQAIKVGVDMRAKYTVLTHFSQRYAKLPRFHEHFTSTVGIAFDNMKVRLTDLPILPLLYPTLKLVFSEHDDELEEKARKRQFRKQREAEASS